MLDLARSVALMAKVGACHSPSLSPDGARIAFIANLSGLPQAWIMPASGGFPTLLTPLEDPVASVSWSPCGEFIALGVNPGGGMNRQLYLIRPDGTGLRLLSDGGRDNNWPGPWSRDARKIAVSSNRKGRSMDLWLVDAATGEWQYVAPGGGMGSLLDISHDGRSAVLSRVVSRGDNNLYLVDLTTGEEHLLTPHHPPASFGGGQFAPDGQTVYLSGNAGQDLVAFARVRLGAGGAPGPIEVLAERPDAELQQFTLSHDGETAALLWNAAGRTELEFLSLSSGARRRGPALPSEIAVGGEFSRDGRWLFLSLMGARAPYDIWRLDCHTGGLQQLTHAQHAGVALESLVSPELVRFPAHDGLELTGWLYRPRGAAAPGPLVLSFHGGPEGQERPIFNSTYQALLAHGVAVLAPNVRGSSGFGRRFVNLDNGELRFDAIRDIKACIDFVVGAGVADARRIGIMGGSYGGYMTMAGLAEYPDLLAAGANLFGLVNFETFFANTEPWMADISKVEYGDPDTQKELLRALSPIHKIGRVKAPTLVLHGANDTNCPVVEAEQVVDSLRERGVPVEYVLFPDEGHGFVKAPNRITAAVSVVAWFTKYL